VQKRWPGGPANTLVRPHTGQVSFGSSVVAVGVLACDAPGLTISLTVGF